MYLKAWFVTGVLLFTTAPFLAAAQAQPGQREVLPSNVTPVHYALLLSPDVRAVAFTARVDIDIDVLASTPQIVLNAEGLGFDEVVIDGGQPGAVSLDAARQRATLSFQRAVPAGRHRLSIMYHGPIGRTTIGFFAMEYGTPEGPRRTLATNFEPAAARQLLPCWDEPGRKASFSVTIDAPKDRMALSNMPVASVESLSPTVQRVHFETTPKMSTYLLFVAVGDFERISQRIDGVDVGVVVKRGDTAKAAYPLKEAVALLHFYNDYFGIAYPLPKLDLIAAPGSIRGAAMENWGAIFFSQETVLFDPVSSTEAERQDVFLVVSHEMAHQWFGNLVTMAWWDDLWLNEGFARWMQTHAADALHPEWETGIRAASIFESGRAADAVPSTHPVVQQVFTAEQAGQSFDGITYDKGAAVITMLHDFVGAEKFRKGVRDYMRRHAYGNTVDTDLWEVMQQSAGADVTAIARDFTHQEGVPLVRVQRTASGVSLHQDRYALDPSTIAGVAAQAWRLPMTLQTVGDVPRNMVLGANTSVAATLPLLVNAGQTGYARVLYDDATFDALAVQMRRLAPIDQLGLINDGLALAIGGYAPAENLLRLIAALPANANSMVWERVVNVLKIIDRRYRAGPQRTAFRRFALATLAPAMQHLQPSPVPGESSNAGRLRNSLVVAQGSFGDAAVITRAREVVARGGSAAEQRDGLAIAAAASDSAGFALLLAQVEATTEPLLRMRILRALATVDDDALARRMIDISLSDLVPAGSMARLLRELASRHADMVWNVVAAKLEDPALPLEKPARWELANAIAGYSASTERIVALEAYQTRNVPENARKPFLGAIASIRNNQRFERQMLPEIDRWIETH